MLVVLLPDSESSAEFMEIAPPSLAVFPVNTQPACVVSNSPSSAVFCTCCDEDSEGKQSATLTCGDVILPC